MKPNTTEEKIDWLKEHFGDSLTTIKTGEKYTSSLEGWNVTGGGKKGPVIQAGGTTEENSVSNLFDKIAKGINLVSDQKKVRVSPQTLTVSKHF